MFSNVDTIGLRGIEGYRVSVESDVAGGLPDFSMVGFLASEVREARERVRTAIRNSDYQLPARKVTVNLSPADVRKEGTSFDLPIALSLLIGFGFVVQGALKSTVVMGELSLDGHVKGIDGVLPRILTARQEGFTRCIVPMTNAGEAALVEGMTVFGVGTLEEAVDLLYDMKKATPVPCRAEELLAGGILHLEEDFSQVHGQQGMKRAAEVAAAGMHNLLLIGTPGAGKSMIARRMPGILPHMTLEESLAVSKVYSVSGLLSEEQPLIVQRPFRSPHHTISTAALVGGGRIPKPGEISLADKGVLFLDELPEFAKTTLEVLRQPMEEREVMISRVQGACRFPADTMIVAAMNPCRCGYYPDRTRCSCSEGEVQNYLRRISRPLLDRMDLCVEAPPVTYEDLNSTREEESSETIRKRVEAAHQIQLERFRHESIFFNAQMNVRQIHEFCALGKEEAEQLEEIFERKKLSARGYHRVLKVARTVADLAGSPSIRLEHLLEAVNLRGPYDRFWGL